MAYGAETTPNMHGTAKHMEQIARLVVPEIVDLKELQDYLQGSSITESFAVAITQHATGWDRFQHPSRGYASHPQLNVGGFEAMVDSGILHQAGEYAGSSLRIYKGHRNPSGVGDHDYSLEIPIDSATNAVNTNDLPPCSWHARLWTPDKIHAAYNPKHPHEDEGKPGDLMVVVKDAANDLARILRSLPLGA